MRIKGKLTFLLALMSITQLAGQTIPVGMPFFEDALRRAQLMGRVDTNVSFMVRPVDPIRALGITNPFGRDTTLFPTDTLRYWRNTDLFAYVGLRESNRYFRMERGYDKTGESTTRLKGNKHLRLTLLPIYTHTRYNKHHPYGWADGPMIPSVGFQQYISGGVFLKAGPLEVQLRPEMVRAQNKEFQNPPFRARQIDMPDRMGVDKYRARFTGQSYIKLHLGPMAVGYSTENLWWGPGLQNAIVMSNNAPGFGHYTIHTNRPIKTRYGTIEGQMVGGKLEYSGFFPYVTRYPAGQWPPKAADIVRDTTGKGKFHSYFNGMTVTWQPKWLPGLFLNINRIVQVQGEPDGLKDYLSILYVEKKGEETGNLEGDAINRNQVVSLSARYLFLGSHAEIYGEIGREDFWFDLEDLLTRPNYSTVWLIGFRKIYPLAGKDRWLQLMGEYTKIQAPINNMVAPSVRANSFYTHGNGVGWTNRGQVMGAGIGPGSNMQSFGLTYGRGFHTFGLRFERVVYNEDLFYNEIDYLRLGDGTNPFFVDISKHYVDWGFIFNHHTSYGKFFVGYQFHLLRTYNFQWNYDPYGASGIFRFPGINVWSINGEISCVYRF